MTPYTTTPVVISADEPDEGDMQTVAVMTLRDYFAARAMPPLIAAICAGQHTTPRIASTPQEGIAIEAYMLADAMLKARAQ